MRLSIDRFQRARDSRPLAPVQEAISRAPRPAPTCEPPADWRDRARSRIPFRVVLESRRPILYRCADCGRTWTDRGTTGDECTCGQTASRVAA